MWLSLQGMLYRRSMTLTTYEKEWSHNNISGNPLVWEAARPASRLPSLDNLQMEPQASLLPARIIGSEVLDGRGIGDLHGEHETTRSLLHVLDRAHYELTIAVGAGAVGPEPSVQVLGVGVGGCGDYADEHGRQRPFLILILNDNNNLYDNIMLVPEHTRIAESKIVRVLKALTWNDGA